MAEPQRIGVIICGPYGFWFRTVEKCPKEGVLRRMLGLDEIYHGISHTCLGCGTHWQENFEYEVPPYKPRGVHDPKWRIKARTKARRTWKTAKAHGGPEHRAWYEAEMKEITG